MMRSKLLIDILTEDDAVANPKLPPFALRLRALLDASGLSVIELAKAAGITRQHVYRMLSGASEPTFSVLCRLADALGVTLNDFRG